MLKRNFLICFTGVDGSGKTAHAISLMRYLKQNGYNCKYVWCGHRPFVSYPFFGLTKLAGYWKRTKKNTFTDPLEYAPRETKKKLAKILCLLFFIDFLSLAFFKIGLPLILGKNIICDRYIYDLIMELKRNNLISEKFSYKLRKLLPNPTVIFLMDAPETLASERRGFTSIDLLSKRRIYVEMGKVFNFMIIDSSKDFLSNHILICNIVLSRISTSNVEI
ncbi:MAG: hypothetical protein QXF61_06645 [Nitrososphaeria archaeon]